MQQDKMYSDLYLQESTIGKGHQEGISGGIETRAGQNIQVVCTDTGAADVCTTRMSHSLGIFPVI
jgi:hypothetical protein